MHPDWLPWLLQVADSQFPSGGYAHSSGLEELVQSGHVRDAATLRKFLESHILPGLHALDFHLLARAHHAANCEDIQTLAALDHEWEAWKPSAELRKAGRQIGERRLALLARLDPDPFVLACRERGVPHQHLIVLALELRRAPLSIARVVWTYQTLSGFALAAMKLLRIGPENCQLLLRELMATIAPTTPPSNGHKDPEGWFNPLLDIASLRHARASERMFIS